MIGERQHRVVGSDTPQPTITCAENGPYLVRGLAGLKGADGTTIQGKKVMALVPLRRIQGQALLRRYARQDRLHRR